MNTPDGASHIPICDLLGDKSASRLWIQHAKQIHAASRLPDDVEDLHHDYTAQLLAMISPRLVHSLKSYVRDWEPVERIMTVAHKRYQYFAKELNPNDVNASDSPPPPPPPIKIVVMGGSVTLGVRCKTGIPGHDNTGSKYCAWPHRLESLVNTLLGFEMLHVSNQAVGATNTAIGSKLLQYQVLSSSILQDADILIHAYSTNDANSVSGGGPGNETLEMLQDFVRLALQPPGPTCRQQQQQHAPLLIHLNDFMGPMSRPILGTPIMSQIVETLSHYYGFVSLSYVDMVRDWVLGDPKETWFSADEFTTGSYKYELHPGQGMHIATAWMVAYNLLQLGLTCCEWNEWKRDDDATDVVLKQKKEYGNGDEEENEEQDYVRTRLGPTGMMEYDDTVLSQTLPLFHNGTNTRTQGVKPRPPPRAGLPPPLTTDGLTMSDLNMQWRTNAKAFRLARNRPCPRNDGIIDNGDDDSMNNSDDSRCPFAWVSGHDTSKDEAWVQENLLSRIVSGNWTLEQHMDFRKTGLTPPRGQVGSEMLVEFQNVKNSVSKVLVFYLKSYGVQWQGSNVRIKILTAAADGDSFRQEARTHLEGDHGTRRTSEMYVEELELDAYLPRGGTLRIYSKLTSGSTFKIMGLLLCS